MASRMAVALIHSESAWRRSAALWRVRSFCQVTVAESAACRRMVAARFASQYTPSGLSACATRLVVRSQPEPVRASMPLILKRGSRSSSRRNDWPATLLTLPRETPLPERDCGYQVTTSAPGLSQAGRSTSVVVLSTACSSGLLSVRCGQECEAEHDHQPRPRAGPVHQPQHVGEGLPRGRERLSHGLLRSVAVPL